MTRDSSGRTNGGSSRIASALFEVLEAADAVPRSVEQLGDASATASQAMRQLSTGLDLMLAVGRRYLGGEPPPARGRKRKPASQPMVRPAVEVSELDMERARRELIHKGILEASDE